MAESITHLLAQAFSHTAENITVNDAGGNRAVSIPTTVARIYLARASGVAAGTEADPVDFLSHVQAQLSSRWTLAMLSSGLVRLTYTGAGTGAITWSSTTTAKLLGFDANTGSLATNGTATGAYLPSHCVFASACDPDTGWVDAPGRVAAPEQPMPDGSLYAFDDGLLTTVRRASYRLLPKDWTTRTSLSAVGTPAYSATSRRTSPATSEPGQALPWGVVDTIATAMGRSCGVAWGTFANLVAGSATTFEQVYLLPESRQGERLTLSVERYDQRRDWSFAVSFYSEVTR